MECMCIQNDYGNINFKLGQVYQCIENVGIQQPFLVCFKDWNNPGELIKGKIFEFAMCKFEVL